ncbi:UNVERIFIED_ORG: hypothetical protein J2W16_001619 [Pseudomonas cremoricolorata]|nr:hypothetical protein [Pseudomonas cremoricolorata]
MPVTSLRKTCVRPSEVAKIKSKIKSKIKIKIKIKINCNSNNSNNLNYDIGIKSFKLDLIEWLEPRIWLNDTLFPLRKRPCRAPNRARWAANAAYVILGQDRASLLPLAPAVTPDVFPRIRWRFCAIAANIAG